MKLTEGQIKDFWNRLDNGEIIVGDYDLLIDVIEYKYGYWAIIPIRPILKIYKINDDLYVQGNYIDF